MDGYEADSAHARIFIKQQKANSILFDHIFGHLERHQGANEIELTAHECSRFMDQVRISAPHRKRSDAA